MHKTQVIVTSKQLILLACIFIIAIAIRILNLDATALWCDEKFSVREAHGFVLQAANTVFDSNQFAIFNTSNNVLKANIALDGGNGIFYTMQLHFWCLLFGSTDTAVRMLSALYGIALVFSVYYIAKKVFKVPAIALLICGVVALNPLLVTYSREARPYAAATFYILWSSYFLFLNFFSHQPNAKPVWHHLLFYILTSVAALLCHYLTAYILVAQGLMVALYVRKRIRLFYFFATSLLVALALIGWMFLGGYEGLEVMKNHNLDYRKMLDKNNQFVQPATVLNSLKGVVQFLLPALGNSLQKTGLHLREIVLLSLLPVYLIYQALSKSSKGTRKFLYFSALCLVIAVAFVSSLAINAGHTISYQPHYANFLAVHVSFAIGAGGMFVWWQHKNVILYRSIVMGYFLISAAALWHYFANPLHVFKPNVPNPYVFVADKILETQKTDTIFFPNITDAQLSYLSLKPETRFFGVDTNSNHIYVNHSSRTILDITDVRY
jgi:uncharacterized membrane protein